MIATVLNEGTLWYGIGAALALSLAPSVAGPYDIVLHAGKAAPTATGEARLIFAASPFGVSVSADGHHRYDIMVTAKDLPAPTSLGDYSHYIAWEVSTNLADWHRLGTISNGTSKVGVADMNKFLLVITAEPSAAPDKHVGPIVLHGSSPSTWLQSFVVHPLFRGHAQ